jgi:hypothetical protein
MDLEVGLDIKDVMGIYTTFRHYAPLFPTKREKGQRKKEEKEHVRSTSAAMTGTQPPKPTKGMRRKISKKTGSPLRMNRLLQSTQLIT